MDGETLALLERHRARYPGMTARDAIKLLYQREFGGGHMIADRSQSLQRLKEETLRVPPDGGASLFEEIGGGLARLNLAAKCDLSLETVNAMFCHTAERVRGDSARFAQALDALSRYAPEWAGEIAAYREDGCPALSHSPEYRARYHPAYRVVLDEFRRYLPLFERVDALLRGRPRAVLAIEGRSAAGKSSLAALLAGVYGAAVFHMDDFFLPPERKTPERLAQPGGNVDYERCAAEVARPLLRGAPFIAYRPYDCASGALQSAVGQQVGRLAVVEGAYSLHPALGDLYDLKVFLTIGPAEQSARILRRNGAQMHRRFVREWIPLEEAYLACTGAEQKCDMTFAAGE